MNIKSDEKTINKPVEQVYSVFDDLSRFADMIPEDKRENLTITKDSIVGSMQGMPMGVTVAEREPYSLIHCTQCEGSMMKFNFDLKLDKIDDNSCSAQFVLDMEVPFMLKMMIEPKMKEAVKQMSDQFAEALNK